MKSHERPSFVIYSYSYFYLCMCYLIFVENICVNFVAYDSKVISSLYAEIRIFAPKLFNFSRSSWRY